MKTSYRILWNNGKVSCNIYDQDLIAPFAKYMSTKTFYPIALLIIRNNPKNENTHSDCRNPSGGVPVHASRNTHR